MSKQAQSEAMMDAVDERIRELYTIGVIERDSDFPQWIEKALRQGDMAFFWKPRRQPIILVPYSVLMAILQGKR